MSGQLSVSVSVSDTGRVSGRCTDTASVADDGCARGGVARGGENGEAAGAAADAPAVAELVLTVIGREIDGIVLSEVRGAGRTALEGSSSRCDPCRGSWQRWEWLEIASGLMSAMDVTVVSVVSAAADGRQRKRRRRMDSVLRRVPLS